MPRTPPPAFGDVDYWDARFDADAEPFEWLQPASAFDDEIAAATSSITSTPVVSTTSATGNEDRGPRLDILNIGSGTSRLPFHLAARNPDARITNVDFSGVAVANGRTREEELIQSAQSAGCDDDGGSGPLRRMRWSQIDLLSASSVAALATQHEERGFGIVVDKSTSDSIACASSPDISLPYAVRCAPNHLPAEGPNVPEAGGERVASAYIHPIHILATHLALLIPPGGRWLSLSYSGKRYPFLDPEPELVSEGRLEKQVVRSGFPHPAHLWKLEKRLEVPRFEAGEARTTEGRVVHRPAVVHHLYVLVRTDVKVELYPS